MLSTGDIAEAFLGSAARVRWADGHEEEVPLEALEPSDVISALASLEEKPPPPPDIWPQDLIAVGTSPIPDKRDRINIRSALGESVVDILAELIDEVEQDEEESDGESAGGSGEAEGQLAE